MESELKLRTGHSFSSDVSSFLWIISVINRLSVQAIQLIVSEVDHGCWMPLRLHDSMNVWTFLKASFCRRNFFFFKSSQWNIWHFANVVVFAIKSFDHFQTNLSSTPPPRSPSQRRTRARPECWPARPKERRTSPSTGAGRARSSTSKSRRESTRSLRKWSTGNSKN